MPKLKPSTQLYLLLVHTVPLFLVPAMIALLFAVLKKDWSFCGWLLAFIVPVGAYTYFILYMSDDEPPDYFLKMDLKLIVDIDDQGFSLAHLDGSLKRIRWKDVAYCFLNRTKSLVVKDKQGKTLVLTKDYLCWYALLQAIPAAKLRDGQIPDFLASLSKGLKTCEVCGAIAVHRRKCLACQTPLYDPKTHRNFAHKKDYLRYQQMEKFSVDPGEAIDFKFYGTRGFRLDTRWRPRVTIKEVLAHSKA